MDAPIPCAVGPIDPDAGNSETEALPVHVQILSKLDAPQGNCPIFETILPEI